VTRFPDFIVAGTMKSGTSSLANWLNARDDVHLAPSKELHFFNAHANFERGPGWYAEKLGAPEDVTLAFEATPLYAFYPEAIDRMAKLLPEAKVIVCLREPGARAYSHYRHFYDRSVVEHRSFHDAVEEELGGDVERPGRVEPGPYDTESQRYVAQGLYRQQLEHVAAAIGGREKLHVVLMDDLRDAPQDAYAKACAFLGLDPGEPPEAVGKRSNAHFEYRPVKVWRRLVRHRVLERLPKKTARWIAVDLMRKETTPKPIDPDVRRRLSDFYAPHNQALAEYLGRDLSRWD
jgi:hypothetical protein